MRDGRALRSFGELDVLEEPAAVSTIAARDKKGQQRDDRHDAQIDDEQPLVRPTAQAVVLRCFGGGKGEVLRRGRSARVCGLALAKAPACV